MAAGLLCGPVALSVRLSVRVLLCILQTELMAHFKRLAHSAHDTHGLCLTGEGEQGEGVTSQQLYAAMHKISRPPSFGGLLRAAVQHLWLYLLL